MAIENNDLVVVQKNGGGELRKATVSALLAGVPTPDTSLWEEDGNAVTPKAADADLKIEGGITAAGNIRNTGATLYSNGSADFNNQTIRINGAGSILAGTTSYSEADAKITLKGSDGSITAAGDITTVGNVACNSISAESSTTNTWFRANTELNSITYCFAGKNQNTNKWVGGLEQSGKLYLGPEINTGDVKITLDGTNGSATFAGSGTFKSLIQAENTYYNPAIRAKNRTTDKWTSWITGNGGLFLGLDLDSNNSGIPPTGATISLDGADGSATFAGSITATSYDLEALSPLPA